MKVSFYMKSGSVITQEGVEDFSYKYSDVINQFTLTYSKDWKGPRLMITSVQLDQIEAIVKEDY